MTFTAHRSYRWLFWTLAVLGLVLDLGSKYAVFGALYSDVGTRKVDVVPGFFSITAAYTGEKDPGTDWLSPLRTISGQSLPAVNQGALFGMGQGKNFLFTIVSLIAAAGITWWSMRPNAGRDFVLTVALGLILAGTLGNLYDRIVFDGVRDFIHWYYESEGKLLFDWPVFNIADCCLVCGASLLLVHALFFHRTAEDQAEGQAVQAAAEAEVVDVR